MSKQIIDISWPLLDDSTVWRNRTPISINKFRNWEEHQARESLDAPCHFVKDGATVDEMDLSKLMGECIVLDMTHVTTKISANDIRSALNGYPASDRILLFKTRNSSLAYNAPFDHNFIALDSSAARYLVELKCKAIGIDYLGIERDQPNHETHIILLSNGVYVIEGLRLGHVQPGEYKLICLPLKFVGLDGAPARAILLPV